MFKACKNVCVPFFKMLGNLTTGNNNLTFCDLH